MGSMFHAFLLLVSSVFGGAVASKSSLDVHEAALPAIGQVITMLANLASMIDVEQEADDQAHTTYQQWSASETAAANQHVGQLQTSIQNTNAVLSDLRARQQDLTTTLIRVRGDLSSETTQLNAATQKRQEENAAYVTEQQNFDSAITACGQGVELLKAHYGDGTPQELQRPDAALTVHAAFLLQARKTLFAVRDAVKRVQQVGKSGSKIAAFLQRASRPNFDTYQDSGAEAFNIVDEVKQLSSTFAEDKQSAIDQENMLQNTFVGLRDQKLALIASLTSERDSQQGQLNQVNQDIAENEGKLQVDTQLLADKQAYLASLASQLKAANDGYDGRKRNRAAEREATVQAKEVLAQVSFMQSGETTARMTAKKASLRNSGQNMAFQLIADHLQQARPVNHLRSNPGVGCAKCLKAVALLREKASMLHSLVLSNAAAAATGLGASQLQDVISRMEGLVTNLDAEQQSEKEHKEWCDTEMGRTTRKRSGHATAAESLQQNINSLGELISMKEIDLGTNQRDTGTEEQAWADLEHARETEKKSYDSDLQDQMDATAAMNQAIKILEDFYSKQSSLLQVTKGAIASKVSFASPVNPRSGSQVLALMTETRDEFLASAAFLRSTEAASVVAHEKARGTHTQAMTDLQSNKDVLTVEKQQAEQGLASNKEDLASNEKEITAANAYFDRLRKSCQPLIDNYDERKKLRGEEKKAINDAIAILGEVSSE